MTANLYRTIEDINELIEAVNNEAYENSEHPEHAKAVYTVNRYITVLEILKEIAKEDETD